MTWINRVSPEIRAEVRAAKKAQSQEDKARKLARARDLLKAKEASFRKPRERDPKFLSWLRKAPCLVCAILGDVQVTRTDPAHVRRAYPEPGWRPVGGAEKPSDKRCLPVCRRHHEEQHERDTHDWYADLGIYPPELCATLKSAQEAGADPAAAIQQVSAEVNRQYTVRRVNS